MSVDKNQAVIEYLKTCPIIMENPLYFNFINAEDNTNQIVTSAEDITTSRTFIDGSVNRRYTFTIITFKAISDNALVTTLAGYPSENVEDLSAVQDLIDWIAAQEDNHNYPNFGSTCLIQSIGTTTDAPTLSGINTEVTPPLAMYSVSIRIDYIDTSKIIWNE